MEDRVHVHTGLHSRLNFKDGNSKNREESEVDWRKGYSVVHCQHMESHCKNMLTYIFIITPATVPAHAKSFECTSVHQACSLQNVQGKKKTEPAD